MLALAPDRLLWIVLLYWVSERKVWQHLGEWQVFSPQESCNRPMKLPKDEDPLENTTEISALTNRTPVFPRETVFSNYLFSSIPPMILCLGIISIVFQLGTETKSNTLLPCCTLFPLPQLDTWRCMQHAVHFAYVLLGCAHFITQKSFSSNITKCLKNRTDKTNILLWQRSLKYHREHRWLWLHFPTALFLLSKYCGLEAFVCVKFYSVILITQLYSSLQFSFHGSVPLLGL